jgi:general secretion pathway protein D
VAGATATLPTNPLQAAANSGTSAAATAPISSAAQPSTGGFIQADPATNSLIITAPEPLYRQVRAMIEQLDTRRAQVAIEGLIVEVNGGEDADFGVQWLGQLAADGSRTLQAAQVLPTTSNPSLISLNNGLVQGQLNLGAGLNVGILRTVGNAVSLNAILRLLQTQSTTNILSTPNVLTLDNEEAKIVVGNNVPFLTGQFTNTGTGTTNPFQTIERRDVGLTLRIRPQIGEGGAVRMTLFLENSDVVGQATGTAGAGPTTSKRSVESNVVVDDRQILVIGGLIQERFEDSRSQVPVLGSLPLVGGLFRSESRTKRRSNLMIFLKPTVLRDAASAATLSVDRYDLIRTQQQGTEPAPNPVLPVQGVPVLPPLPSQAPSQPLSQPPSQPAPGAAPVPVRP